MLNQIDKMRESRFCRALFAAVLIIGLCLPSTLLGIRSAYADDGKTRVVFVLDGNAHITIDGEQGSQTLSPETPTLTLDLDTGTFVHMTGELASESNVAVYSRDLEDTYDVTYPEGFENVLSFEKDISATGIDKVVTIKVDDLPAGYRLADMDALRSEYALSTASITTQSSDVPYVGETFTGSGQITHMTGGNGHTTYDMTYSAWSGIANGKNVTVYCDDHGKASPVVNRGTWNYTARVTAIDYSSGKVTLSFKVVGTGEYKPADNYQTLSGVGYVYRDFGGYMELHKESANTEITEGNDCYSLAGAEYSLFSSLDDAKKAAEGDTGIEAAGKATTNDEGYAKTGLVKAGHYYVVETTPAQNYALDRDGGEQSDGIYEIDIENGKTTTLNSDNGGIVYDEPQNDPAWVLIGKFDGDHTYNGEQNIAQAKAPSLAGAQFEVKFYPTLDEDYSSVEPLRTWYLETNENGYCNLHESFFAQDKESDPLFKALGGTPTLPLGTLTFKEIKAPEGYNLEEIYDYDANGNLVPVEDGIYVRQVTGDHSGDIAVDTFNMPIVPNYVDRGGISIEKRDLETNELTPQGAASLDGTTFDIVFETETDHVCTVDDIDYKTGDVVKTLTIKNGVAFTDDQCLPYGDYSIRETTPGQGYNLTDGEKRYFSITEDHQMIHYSDTVEGAEGGAFKNQVKRGDLKFIKKLELTENSMSGIPFKITSKTTGESHIVVTDENGEVNTEASWNKHSYNTNGNDGGNYDPANGIWFGINAPVNDEVGALPYDDYTIEELPCDKNTGLTLVTRDVKISRDSVTIDIREIENHVTETESIVTRATDAIDSDKLITADTEAVINDHVEYSGLKANEQYTMTATLMDKQTGETIPGATAQVTFTTKAANGFVEMQIPVNLVDYKSHDVVVFEVLSQGGSVVVEHQEIDDSEQTLHVVAPEIGTTATDDADGDHKIINDTEATIIDTVRYENLVPGKEYTATGTLMVKSIDEDGDVEATELLDKDGNPITVTTQFTPKSASGSIDVVFVFDASMLESGTQLVVFEKVLRGDVVIAAHEDPTDSNQTVETIVPEIGTTAVDGVDGDKNVVSDKGMRVVDTIAYENLVVGKEYTATGKLMEKVVDENGNVTERELTDDHGNTIEAKATFTPTAPNGEVEVEFVFDGYNLEKGTQIVAFEEVFDKDKSVAVHADINDENQLVEVVTPEIGTSAYDAFDLDGLVIADKDAKIIDTVKYENLIPGKEYTVGGIVMDKTTGMPLLSGEGADQITDGELATFMHGLATLLGISDDEFAAMTATDSAGATSEFVDFVGELTEGLGVENPLAGFTDRIVSDVNVNSDVVSEYLAENAKIVNCLTFAQKNFTPNTADGSVDMTFPVNTEGMDGKELVIYELMFANDVIQASHADITDKGQTVEVVSSSIGTTATDKTDGDHYLLPSTDAVVVDTVDYENLVPGKEYTLKGWLMDKATGKQLVIDDKPVTSEIKFTPNNTSGKVDIEFKFDASKLADGAELVAFEELYKDNVLVAEHKDIDDEGQTVTIGEPPATPEDGDYAKTGENLIGWIILALALVAGATTLTVYGVRKRNAHKSEASAEDIQSTPNE